ncbi:MAG: pilus assembly protein PilP [Thermodesulfovibrionales bacterium]|nr:pilus assembly protein PilP [Thermodesulfovibrionales bacterium]
MRSILLGIFVSMFVLFAGCGKEQPPPQKATAEKMAQPDAKTEEKAATEAAKSSQETVTYDARGRRDPFLPLIQVSKEKPKKKAGASPIESYGIDELSLLAIAWDKDKFYALVMLPDRKTYTITEGMALGLQGGKVEKITNNTVLIREYIKDYRGEIKPRDSILKLHKGEE